MPQDNAALQGQLLKDVLHELAMIDALASSLRLDLEPLSVEDRALGAEPLTNEQIQEELEKISKIASSIALVNLNAEPSDWYAATESIE